MNETASYIDLPRRRALGALLAVAAATQLAVPAPALGKPDSDLDRKALSTLQGLYAKVPAAKALGPRAHAILVFPSITKAGLGVGGQYGDGALIRGGKVIAHYNTAGASYGLQAGAQQFAYAMFFMNDKALKQLDRAEGFEVGVGPSVVVVDEGMGKMTTTNTLGNDVYAFVFGQKGLMAGAGLQGNKITRIQ